MAIPTTVLQAWGWSDCTTTPLTGGLINQTFCVTRGDAPIAVLQQMHPIFRGEVNLDIAALGAHIRQRDPHVRIPDIIPTQRGPLWVTHEERPWRALQWLDGTTIHRVEHAAQAQSAGALVGRFHRALDTFDHAYAFERPGVHDTARHLDNLRQQLANNAHASFPEAAEALALGRDILAAVQTLPTIEDLTLRHCHGDLKISNLLFSPSESHQAIALVDLDTIGRMPLAHELGDALRSWCNPRGEDADAVVFRADLFAAAMQGYQAEVAPLSLAVKRSIVAGLVTICIELAARFCADVFADAYFGWDAAKFPSRRAHNLRRATRQLELGLAAKHQTSSLLDAIV